jgi:hypothetical protein
LHFFSPTPSFAMQIQIQYTPTRKLINRQSENSSSPPQDNTLSKWPSHHTSQSNFNLTQNRQFDLIVFDDI